MKLVLHCVYTPLIFRAPLYHLMLLLLLVIQLASIVTLSMAYPLASTDILGNGQGGLVRRMPMNSQSSLPPSSFPCNVGISGYEKRFRIQDDEVPFLGCRDKGGYAWWPLGENQISHGICFRVRAGEDIPPPPPPEVAARQGTCIEEISATLSTKHLLVHPCRSEFSLTFTEQYKSLAETLLWCTKSGIAFWPGRSVDGDTCGLVWPDMRLSSKEAELFGTCFVGPQIPTNLKKGLHPCDDGFRPEDSFYRVSGPGSQTVKLLDCANRERAVAWRERSKLKGMCVKLPYQASPALAGRSGYCYELDVDAHRKWYSTQVLQSHDKTISWWQGQLRADSDWVELSPSRLSQELPRIPVQPKKT